MTSQTTGDEPNKENDNTVYIKKYANRRMYNSNDSCYITLDDIATLVKRKVDVVVIDNTTGKDITNSTLASILVELDEKNENLLPRDFLRNLIGFYGQPSNQSITAFYQQVTDYMMDEKKKFEAYSETYPMGNMNGSPIIPALEQTGQKLQDNWKMMLESSRSMNPFDLFFDQGKSGVDEKSANEPSGNSSDKGQAMLELLQQQQRDTSEIKQRLSEIEARMTNGK